MPEHDAFDPYYKWLGIPAEEQPPNHYRLLAIRLFESDLDVIDAAAEQRMTLLRSRQTGKYGPLSQKLLNELAAARAVLLDPDRRRAYDEQLKRKTAEVPLAPVVPTAASTANPWQPGNIAPGQSPLEELPVIATQADPFAMPVVAAFRAPAPRPNHGAFAAARTPSPWPLLIALGGGGIVLLAVIVLGIAVAMNLSDSGAEGSGTVTQGEPQRPKEPTPNRKNDGAPAGVPQRPPHEPVNLLARIDLGRDVVSGEFQLEDGALIVPAVQAAQLELSPAPPSAYRLELVAERISGNDSLNCGIVCGGRQTMIVFDGFGRTASGLNLLDGRSASRSPTAYRKPIFTDGAPKLIVCTVHPGQIHVLCDGETIVDWQGDPARLSLDQRFWKVRTPGRLIIGGWGTSFRITQLRLTDLSE